MRPVPAAVIGTAFLLVAAFAAADTVIRVDDGIVVGKVTQVDSSSVVVQPAGNVPAVSIPAGEVLSVQFDAKPAEPKGDVVIPSSGERFHVIADAAGADVVPGTLVCRGAGSLAGANKIPFADLRAWFPTAGPGEKSVSEVLSLENERDIVFLASGDRITGVVESVNPAEARITAKLGAVGVKRDAIKSVAFSKTLKPWREPVRLLAEARLVDGSIVIGEVTGPKDGIWTLKSVSGPQWTAAADQMLELRFRGGKLLWLSDLTPVKAETTPFFNRAWPWRKDLSVWGNPLKAGGVTYERGIGTHSRTELTYDLAAQFATFLVELAIDDETKGAGSAVVSVTADGRALLAPTTVSGGEKPRRIKLDVTGVRQITLLVDFGKDQDSGDHLDWLAARVIRK